MTLKVKSALLGGNVGEVDVVGADGAEASQDLSERRDDEVLPAAVNTASIVRKRRRYKVNPKLGPES